MSRSPSAGERIVGTHGLDDRTVTFVGSSHDVPLGDQCTRRGFDHPPPPSGERADQRLSIGAASCAVPQPSTLAPAAEPCALGDDPWSPFWVQAPAYSW